MNTKLDVNVMIKPIEMNGGKVKKRKYSKWRKLKNGRVQDTVTLFQITLFDNLTFMVSRDTTKEIIGQGEGNGLQWIKENQYITENQFWKENNAQIDEEEDEEV